MTAKDVISTVNHVMLVIVVKHVARNAMMNASSPDATKTGNARIASDVMNTATVVNKPIAKVRYVSNVADAMTLIVLIIRVFAAMTKTVTV